MKIYNYNGKTYTFVKSNTLYSSIQNSLRENYYENRGESEDGFIPSYSHFAFISNDEAHHCETDARIIDSSMAIIKDVFDIDSTGELRITNVKEVDPVVCTGFLINSDISRVNIKVHKDDSEMIKFANEMEFNQISETSDTLVFDDDIDRVRQDYTNTKMLTDKYKRLEADRFEDSNNMIINTIDKPDADEIEADWNEWNMMTKKQRRVSDWKSLELYDKTNKERYEEYIASLNKNIEESASTIIVDDTPLKLKTNYKYDIEAIQKAKDWMLASNLMVILPTNDLSELELNWSKWNSYPLNQRRKSNWKCEELFGMNNKDVYEYLRMKFLINEKPEQDNKEVQFVPNKEDDDGSDVTAMEEVTHLYKNNKTILNDMQKLALLIRGESLNESTVDNIEYHRMEKDIFERNAIRVPNFITIDIIPSDIRSYINTIEESKFPTGDIWNRACRWFELYESAFNGFITDEFIEFNSTRSNDICTLISDSTEANNITLIMYGYDRNITNHDGNTVKTAYLNNIRFNMIDVSNMSCNYIEDLTEEAFVTEKIKPIYIALVFSNTIIGKTIAAYTRGKFSHATISFDSDLDTLYSYKMGGFQKEHLAQYFEGTRDLDIAVFAVFVTVEDYNKLKKKVKHLENIKTNYNLKNIFNIVINKPGEQSYDMICSQFVDYILKCIDVRLIDKDSTLVTPNDFYKLNNPNLYKLYEGKASTYILHKKEILGRIALLKSAVKVSYKTAMSFTPIGVSNYLYKESTDLSMCKLLESYIRENGSPIAIEILNPYVNPVLMEVAELPAKIDDNGDLLIKNISKVDYDEEYAKCHKLLMLYNDKDCNVEGTKEELAKLWFINNAIEKKLFNSKTKLSKEEKDKLYKTRARIINDFNKYTKLLLKVDKKFNFSEYYNTTPYSSSTIKINKATLRFTGNLIKDLITMIK